MTSTTATNPDAPSGLASSLQVQDDPTPPAAPRTQEQADGENDSDQAPESAQQAVPATPPPAPAPPADPAALHPVVAKVHPGVSGLLDDDGIYGRALTLAAQNGMSARGQMRWAKQILAQKEANARYKTEDLKAKAEQYDQIAGRTDSFLDQPDDYKQRNWSNFLDGLTRDGLMTPQEHQATLAQFQQYPGDDAARYLGRMHLAESQLMKLTLNDQDVAAKKSQVKASDAETANRQAELPGIQATSDQKQIQTYGQQLGASTDQASYDTVRGNMPKKWADQLPDVFDPKTTPALINRWAQTSQQRVTTDATAARNAQTAAHDKVIESQGAQRLGVAQQRLGIEQTNQGQKSALGGLSPAEFDNQTRALTTEARGYVADRARIRTILAQPYTLDQYGNPVLDTKGNPIPMSGAQRQILQSQLDTATGNLQNLQYRSVQLLGHGQPPEGAAEKTPDGQSVVAADGHEWLKRDGILYSTGKPPATPPGAPTGAQPAEAYAPSQTVGHKIGDVVSVKGKQVRITKMYPNGTFDGIPVGR